MDDDHKARVCTRCGTIGRPQVAKVAVVMACLAVLLIAWAILNAILGHNEADADHWILGMLFYGAILYPRVCKACQGRDVIPLDTPGARRLLPPG